MTKPRKTTLATAIAGAVLSLAGISTSALAQTEPKLVKDIDITEEILSSMTSAPVNVDGVAYFRGPDNTLWRSDGTEAGSQQVKDGDWTLAVKDILMAGGDKVYYDQTPLSVTDGTQEGTKVLVHSSTGIEFNLPNYLTEFNEALYFFYEHTSGRQALWKTDGDNVYLVHLFSADTNPNSMVAIDGRLYFTAGINELWVTDGTSAGMQLLTDEIFGSRRLNIEYSASDSSGRFHFLVEDYGGDSIWRSDGTVAGTHELLRLETIDTSGFNWLNISDANGEAYFIDRTPDGDWGMYKTNGKEDPQLVTLLADMGTIGDITVLENQAYIAASNGLWVTDGSGQGTVQLLSVELDKLSDWSQDTFAEHQGELYFSTDSEEGYGKELWKTDGTLPGTVMVKDIAWQVNSSSPHYLTSIDAGLLFQANKGNHLGGDSIWITNGTAASTQKVADLGYATKDANPSRLTEFKGDLFFVAETTWDESLQSLWKTDGTEAGTIQLREFDRPSISVLSEMQILGDYLYFRAGVNGTTILMRSDGTASGTEALTDLLPSYISEDVETGIKTVGDALLFAADTGTSTGLWKLADGATSATLIADGFRSISNQTVNNGVLYFLAYAGDKKYELWRSEGTEETTVLMETVDYADNLEISDIRDAGEGRVLFDVTWNYGNYNDIWITNTDGSAAQPFVQWDAFDYWQETKWATPVGNGRTVYANEKELFVYKGPDQEPELLSTADSYFRGYQAVGDIAYFIQDDDNLWQTDGTAAGTQPVHTNLSVKSIYKMGENLILTGYDRDDEGNRIESTQSLRVITPGASSVVELTDSIEISDVVSDNLFVGDGDLWQTDGTAAGTFKLMDDFVLPKFSSWSESKVLNNRFYFAADRDLNGKELWSLPLSGSDASNTGAGQIGNYVWSDTNGDGVQGADEPGLAGVTVNLWQGCTSSNILTTTTDQHGAFLFDNLPVDDYRLEFITPNGYTLSPNWAAGDYTRDSTPDPSTGLDECKFLEPDQVRHALDAGFTPDGDTLTVKQAVYYSANNKLWLKALSDAEPEGVATLAATAVTDGVETKLGEIYWKSHKSAYQHMFKNVTQAPDKIIVTSDMGGSVVVEVVVK